MANWNRQYRMKVTTKDGSFYEIGEQNTQCYALHINFTVKRYDSPTLDTALIKVWNLSKSEIETLMKEECTITLTAGYGSTLPVIFKGTVSTVDEGRDGADRCTTIYAVDGLYGINNATVSVTYEKNTSASKILFDMAREIFSTGSVCVSYSASATAQLEKTFFAEGYSFIGYAKDVLDDIASVAGIKWTIQNEVLQVCKEGECIDTNVNILDKTTGLIDIPKRISNIEVATLDSNASNPDYGYMIEYFLNGSIGIGDKVRIDTDKVTGIFRVSDLVFYGDNMEGNWKCTAKVTEVKE